MTSVLIVSDSHGLTDKLSEIKTRHPADYYVHCGDSELDMDAGPLEEFYKVAGNCDHDSRLPNEEVLELDGITFLIVHGHLHRVKQGLHTLSLLAQEKEADIVCFGHTHVAGTAQDENRLFINPGSIRQSRGEIKEKTYAIVEWDETKKITVKYFTADGERYPLLDTEVQL